MFSQVKPYVSNFESVEARNLVIVGDGPIAFLLAIKLRQRGVENITLVGPHTRFSRAGEIDLEVFSQITKAIAPLKVRASKGRHLKDIERGLYKHVEALGIHHIPAHFVGVGKNELLIKEASKPIVTLACDIVFDCTGTSRAVLKNMNTLMPHSPPFTFFPLGEIPHHYYAQVRMLVKETKMTKNDNPILNPKEIKGIDPIFYVEIMREFRKLGWQKFSLPHSYGDFFEHKSRSQVKKTNLFIELPESWRNEPDSIEKNKKLLSFIKWMIILCRNDPAHFHDPHIELLETTNSSKRNISYFTVSPEAVYPSYYKSEDFPLIFHQGDATGNLPFYTGKSLIFGIGRINILLDALKIENGKIAAIDFAQYERKINSEIFLLNMQLSEAVSGLNRLYQQLLPNPFVIYPEAFIHCQDPIKRQQIKKDIVELQHQFPKNNFISTIQEALLAEENAELTANLDHTLKSKKSL